MMCAKIFLFVITLLISNIHCKDDDDRLILNKDVCYDDLGCFTTRPPFSKSLARPVALLPDTPQAIDTRFYLYTRRSERTRLLYNETNPNFNPKLETKFIIHGFLHNGFKKFVMDMKDAFLKVGDFNVVAVDWSRKNGFPYTQATANTQVVGAEIARLVNTLAKEQGLKPENVHIIGHSLGAHTAGYAGERIKNLGRITGLDPAGPYFENTDTAVRLDETDAQFVDVLHTDGSKTFLVGLGLLQRSGHVDFYPNGGLEQPKCAGATQKILHGIYNLISIDVEGIEQSTGCSHLSAVYYFTDSILNKECKYIAYPCNNQEDFDSGACSLRCGSSGCNQMGYWATKNKDTGKLFLQTQDSDNYPYCQHHYLVTMNSNTLREMTQTRGTFTVELDGNLADSQKFLMEDESKTIKPGSTEKRLISLTKDLGEEITQLKVGFKKTSKLISSWLYQDKWSFKDIDLLYGDYQQDFKFCPKSLYIESGSEIIFKPC